VLLLLAAGLFIAACLVIWSYPERRQISKRLAEMPMGQRFSFLFGLSHFLTPVLSWKDAIFNILTSFGVGIVCLIFAITLMMKGLHDVLAPKQHRLSDSASLATPDILIRSCPTTGECRDVKRAGFDKTNPNLLLIADDMADQLSGDHDFDIKVTVPARMASSETCPVVSLMYVTSAHLRQQSYDNLIAKFEPTPTVFGFHVDTDSGTASVNFHFTHMWPVFTPDTIPVGSDAYELIRKNWCKQLLPVLMTVTSTSMVADRKYKIIPERCAKYTPPF
jgi:hypothetical protein